MKTVLISAYRIKQYFINNKLIFIFYLIGSVLCGLMFIYFYGNGVSYMRNSLSENISYRQYTVYFSENTESVLNEDVVAFLGSSTVEDALFGVDIPLESGENICLASMYKNNLNRYKDIGRIYFTDKELSDRQMSIIIPAYEQAKIGEHVSINDYEFEVIGKAYVSFGEYCIPYTTFCKLNITPTFLKVISAERQNIDNDFILRQLHELYPDEIVEGPIAEKTDKSRASGEIVFVCIVYAVCMIVFACLVKYMVELSAAENIICTIVGASRAKLIQLLLNDSLFLSALSAGLSILIHYLCRNSVFENLNQAEILYRGSDYFLIFLFMITISVLMIIPFICIICRNSIIQTRNNFET